MKPHMSDSELALLKKHLPFGGKVLEFGSGGSTRFFIENGVYSLVSVESDPVFLQQLGQDKLLAHFCARGRWLPLHADIGPVGNWGAPVGPVDLSWLNYHQRIWDQIPGRDFDLVLIDGRFRVACLCQTILNCGKSPLIAMHDYANRPQYHVIEQFCRQLECIETMSVFTVSPDFSWPELLKTFLDHQFVPA